MVLGYRYHTTLLSVAHGVQQVDLPHSVPEHCWGQVTHLYCTASTAASAITGATYPTACSGFGLRKELPAGATSLQVTVKHLRGEGSVP